MEYNEQLKPGNAPEEAGSQLARLKDEFQYLLGKPLVKSNEGNQATSNNSFITQIVKQELTIQKPISPLKLTLTIILVVSLLYPVFFAYIDRNFQLPIILRELVFTAARLCGIALIIYGVIQLNNFVFKGFKAVWLRYIVEIILILFCTYWFLYGFVTFIDRPLTGSNPADPKLWTFRRYIGLYMLGTVFIYTFLSGLNIYLVARQREAQSEKLQREYAQVRLQALEKPGQPAFFIQQP